jgi:penicillin-binding protein 1A
MQDAIKKYGGSAFKVPPGGYFVNINRFTGDRVDEFASGADTVAEYFREGTDVLFGFASMIDGGFAMGQNLPLFQQGESDYGGTQVINSNGQIRVIPPKADFGTVSSGGLY